MIIGIDLSLRSTGICILYKNNNIEFKLIQRKEDDEELIINATNEIIDLIKEYNNIERITSIHLEGLSYNSLSQKKDLIAGLFWYLRCNLKINFPFLDIKILPVQKWRNKIITKEDRKYIKELKEKLKNEVDKKNKNKIKNEINIKEITFKKLPDDIKKIINQMVKNNKERYDLADAYFICNFKEKEG